MSGNLKILVHKSWHVWKRENREKVARDERKFKEDNEEKEERQKSLTQEKNLELLHESHAAAQALAGPSDQIVDVPFRLFGDIEELEKKNKELKDQNQAKKDKEFNDKKKSGEAPWALGEGAAEKIGQTPSCLLPLHVIIYAFTVCNLISSWFLRISYTSAYCHFDDVDSINDFVSMSRSPLLCSYNTKH